MRKRNGVGYDMNDALGIIDAIKRNVEEQMGEVGELAVQHAVENGNYQNRTGNLRASNRYSVNGNRLRIENTAPYASNVESKGFDVCSGAALFAEKELRHRFGHLISKKR